jgi:hypothetical protein
MPPTPPPALSTEDARVSLSWPHYNYLRRWRPIRWAALALGVGWLLGTASCTLAWLLNH